MIEMRMETAISKMRKSIAVHTARGKDPAGISFLLFSPIFDRSREGLTCYYRHTELTCDTTMKGSIII